MIRPTPADVATYAQNQARIAAELAQACTCTRPNCRTIGDHVWWATREAGPGIKAANLDPGRSTAPPGLTLPNPRDQAMADEHAKLLALLDAMWANAAAFQAFLNRWAPNRERVVVVDQSDWCRWHLEAIETCEPRYRGDLCRRCYDFNGANAALPPAVLLKAWHRGERVTARQVAEALAEQKAARRKARKRSKARV